MVHQREVCDKKNKILDLGLHGLPLLGQGQRYTYRVLQTIQMEVVLLCVWAEPAVLDSAKTALEFKYEI